MHDEGEHVNALRLRPLRSSEVTQNIHRRKVRVRITVLCLNCAQESRYHRTKMIMVQIEREKTLRLLEQIYHFVPV